MSSKSTLTNRIDQLQRILYVRLLRPVFTKHDECKEKGKTDEQISAEMNHYKSRFIELMPYMLILNGENSRTYWKHIAYRVWHNDIERLRNAKTFSKEDVDVLIYMKRLAPARKNYHQKYCGMIDALKNFFQFALQGMNDTPFIEEALELSVWIDSLCQSCPIEELAALNKSWKRKYRSKCK